MEKKFIPWIVFSVLAGIGILISIILIFTLHMIHTTTRIVTPTPTPTPTPVPNPTNVAITTITIKPMNLFQQGLIDTTISAVASVISNTPTPTTTPPTIPPNMLAANLTFSQPLQITPQALGFPLFTPDQSQLITSMENGQQAFGQFQQDPDDPTTYNFFKVAYVAPSTSQDGVSNSNRFIHLVTTQNNQTQLEINDNASGLGCIGVKSMALSTDGLRLYIGYRDSALSESNIFPFEQVSGKVQVWTRNDKSDIWQHIQPFADIVNPFANQVGGVGLTSVNNRFTNTVLSGDDFGSYMIALGSGEGNYEIACACQTGPLNTGRSIMIFKEQNDFSYAMTGLLSLPLDEKSVSSSDRLSFAQSFSFAGDTIIASLGLYNNPGNRRLAWYQRSNNIWQFSGFITNPDSSELFGTSMVLHPLGFAFVVGSPKAPNPSTPNVIPIGGHVYMYLLNSSNQWVILDSLSDPYLTDPIAPNVRTFGWFVSTDNEFRILCVSANQNSLYLNPFPLTRPALHTCTFSTDGVPTTACLYGVIDVFSMDVNSLKFHSDKFTRVFQDSTINDFIDPLFGAQVSVVVGDTRVVFGMGSPLNQKVMIGTMGRT